MPLRDIKVLEFAGLVPAPFCGKVLADFGATVTRIDRVTDNPTEYMHAGKNTLALNIKDPKAQDFVKSLCRKYDVLIDPFRAGVMERNNLGSDILLKDNPRLIYARLTGFGQNGPLAKAAGHDINYVALSGILSFLGRKGEKPTPPINLLADMAGGGLLCAFGICLALLERHRSGKGQIVDNAMVEGCAYIGSWLFASQHQPFWGKLRGESVFDSGTFFYDTYETKDARFMSVAPIEPQFFELFVDILDLPALEQFGDNERAKTLVAQRFKTKTQDEWSEIFEKTDACVFPVVEWNKAGDHKHNKARGSFNENGVPTPAPKLSRTPGKLPNGKGKDFYRQALDVLEVVGMDENDLRKLIDIGVIRLGSSKL